MSTHRYSSPERTAIYRVIHERRDMRHFLPNPVDPECLQRLIEAAHHGPSVGFMQPWRILRIRDPELRLRLHAQVELERQATAAALSQRSQAFLQLKVEGMLQCAELLVIALCSGRDAYVFGRRTMPSMDLASAACAIQNMWLAARAEGLGMGWVSLFEPQAVREVLHMPDDAEPIAILCLGHVDTFYSAPYLEQSAWDCRRPLDEIVMQDRWTSTQPADLPDRSNSHSCVTEGNASTFITHPQP